MREYVPKEWRVAKERWLEMIYFSRQYNKRKVEIDNIRFEYRAAMNGSGTVSSSATASPVEQKADRIAALRSKNDMIEMCCRIATKDEPGMYHYLFVYVTNKVGYAQLGCPCGKNKFSQYRKYYFYLLNTML